ncbi:MAG: hypothetical protein L0H15_05845 [Nitrosospira sp.]|nr:hypothetical protein [Nitrosospira sp.]MDN5836618.1 hypothetical protein [Nitrosospira sp.]
MFFQLKKATKNCYFFFFRNALDGLDLACGKTAGAKIIEGEKQNCDMQDVDGSGISASPDGFLYRLF